MPVFIISLFTRLGLSQRLASIAAWIAAALAIIALCALLWAGFDRYLATREAEAVAIDQKDVTLEAANRVLAADREADANQQAADDAFDNSQDHAKEATDEAARNRTSPLDSLFGELRK